jgi:hypothetical protein
MEDAGYGTTPHKIDKYMHLGAERLNQGTKRDSPFDTGSQPIRKDSLLAYLDDEHRYTASSIIFLCISRTLTLTFVHWPFHETIQPSGKRIQNGVEQFSLCPGSPLEHSNKLVFARLVLTTSAMMT